MFNSRHANAAPNGRFLEIPRLMVGFDTETTGLWKPSPRCGCVEHKEFGGMPVGLCPRSTPEDLAKDNSIHEPITYGFTTYRDGLPTGETDSYVVMPSRQSLDAMMDTDRDPDQMALKTHKWTPRMLQDSYNGNHVQQVSDEPNPSDPSRRIVTRSRYEPAINRITGMQRAVQHLADAQRRGAVIVGANHVGFDLAMLKHHYELSTGQTMKSAGFDLDRAHREGKLLDVIDQQWNIEGNPVTPKNGRPSRRRLSDPTPEVQAVNIKNGQPKKKDTLCDIYGVQQGNHTAAEDARASLDIAVKQILTNQGKFTPNEPRLG